MNGRKWRSSGIAGALLLLAQHAYAAPFSINFNFTGLTPTEQATFASAASTWTSYLTGYQPGISIPSLTIDASAVSLDGAGNTISVGGPTSYTAQGGFLLPLTGQIQLDTADLAAMTSGGYLLPIIQHEMAHAMGFGTLWTANSVYVNGSGQYTGANALAAYQTEFSQPGATFVPVQLGAGAGIDNSHWAENPSGVCCTGILSPQGDKTYEVMTGWLNIPPSPNFISLTTVKSFQDIGYLTVAAVPEPETYAMMLAGLGLMGFVARRRRRETANFSV